MDKTKEVLTDTVKTLKELDAREELVKHRVDEKKNQLATELARYKQDCRKRALEMAHAGIMRGGNSCFVDLEQANKYYEWLTKDLS